MTPNGGPAEPVHELIAKRWSPRAFANRSVSPAVLRRLFEAGRWAASWYNEQPWRWLVAISIAHTSFDRNGKPNRHFVRP